MNTANFQVDQSEQGKTHPLWFMGIRNPRNIGYYSGNPRDFIGELQTEEQSFNTSIKMFLPEDPDSIYNDPDFREECENMWQKFMKNAGEDFTQKVKICFMAQSHIDIAWKWRLGQSIKKAQMTFGNAIRHMELFPNFSFSASQPALYEMVMHTDPKLFEKIKQWVKNGRFEIVGACWTEPDPRMPSGEAFARQHLYGQRFYLRYFGKIAEIAWFQDSFGYSVQMPQYSARSGCKYYFTNKIASNKETVFPSNVFHWYSPDGSHMLSYWAPGGFSLPNMWRKFKDGHRMLKPGEKLIFDYRMDKPEDLPCWSNEYVPVCGAFYGKGDGGHGPTGEEWAWVRYFTESGRNVTPSKAIDFYHELDKVADRLPEFHDELYYEFHRATLTTHHLVKYMTRRMEWTLQGLEAIAAIITKIAPETQFRYPYERITRLWKNICTLHMHDILPGSSVPEVYDDCWDCWQLFNQWTGEMKADIVNALKTHAKLETGVTGVLVVNPVADMRCDPIEIEWSNPTTPFAVKDTAGNLYPLQFVASDSTSIEPLERKNNRLIFTAPLKAWEIKTFEFIPTGILPAHDVTVIENKDTVELTNRFYILSVRRSDGALISLKLTGEPPLETLAGPSNITIAFEDFLLGEPAWNFSPTYRQFPLDEEGIKRYPVEIIERGPVRWTLAWKVSMEGEDHGTATFTHTLSIYANAEGIDINTTVDWHMHEISVKTYFDIAGNPEESIAEVANGTIRRLLRPTANHDKPRWENNMQTFLTLPARDESFCFNILNEGKYGFDNINGNRIGISMIRGPRYPDAPGSSWVVAERINRKKAGLGEPYDVTDQGGHIIRLRLLPRRGSWSGQQIEQAAHAFNCPVLTSVQEYKPWNYIPYDGALQGVEISCLKVSEALNESLENWDKPAGNIDNSALILRVYETRGHDHNASIPIPVEWKVKHVNSVDLVEIATKDSISFSFDEAGYVKSISGAWKPHEIKTFILKN
jgi:alpha-mannosidase